MGTLLFDGSNSLFGRMASRVAKELLKGNTVSVINCEQILISGSKDVFVHKLLRKRRMGRGGSMKGPKYIRQPDMLVKRMIRGMLPRDTTRGQEAFKRLRCYVGCGDVSEEAAKQAITFSHVKPQTYATIKSIVETLR